jgi:hypothetical protein
MPRKTKKEALAKRQRSDELFLFDLDALPIREDVVEIVRTERYRNTGARLLDNEELTQRVVNRLCLRHGVERIARDEHISPHSIRAARDVLVAQGKMAGFQRRFIQRSEEILEAGLEAFYAGILSGDVGPGQLPVGLGIVFDKRQLALGEPTSISATDRGVKPEALSVQALNQQLESLTVDVESIVVPQTQAQTEAANPPDAPFDAPSTRPNEPAPDPTNPTNRSLDADRPEPARPAAAAATDGGGGVCFGGGG